MNWFAFGCILIAVAIPASTMVALAIYGCVSSVIKGEQQDESR